MEDMRNITWLDYTLQKNPQGVLKVLADYGYIGMLAPQSIDQAKQFALEVMDQYDDEGIIALMKVHPEYSAFEELFSAKSGYRNAVTGVTGKIDAFVSRLSPIDQMLVATGVFLGMYYILQQSK